MWRTLFRAAKKTITNSLRRARNNLQQQIEGVRRLNRRAVNVGKSGYNVVQDYITAAEEEQANLEENFYAAVYIYDTDGEACEVCQPKQGSMLKIGYDGEETKDSKFETPPVHPNCDCTLKFLDYVPKDAVDAASADTSGVYKDDPLTGFFLSPLTEALDNRAERYKQRRDELFNKTVNAYASNGAKPASRPASRPARKRYK